jgi:hypothetical protein
MLALASAHLVARSPHQHEARLAEILTCHAPDLLRGAFVYFDFSSRLSVSFQRSSINVCLVFVVPPVSCFFSP